MWNSHRVNATDPNVDDMSTLDQVMVGAAQHQATTWTNVDQVAWSHMVSLGANKFKIVQ